MFFLIGIVFYSILGALIFAVSPLLFWILFTAWTVHSFMSVDISQKTRHRKRRLRNQLASRLS